MWQTHRYSQRKMRGMVERIRKSNLYGFLAAICLEFLAMFVHSSQDDETPDEESAAAIHEKPLTQIAPPPASMPIGNRYVHAEPQNYYTRFTPVDDWMLGMPPALRDSVT
jgi:hypothetical protein